MGSHARVELSGLFASQRRRALAGAVASFLAVVPGCSAVGAPADIGDEGPAEVEDVGRTEQAHSGLAAERIIPLRVIQVLEAAGDADIATLQSIQLSVQKANETYGMAGIQFFVSKIERHVMATFSRLDQRQSPAWETVRDQLKLVFPNLDLNAWPGNVQNELFWLRRASTVYGAPHELLLWIHKSIRTSSGGTVHYGTPIDGGSRGAQPSTSTETSGTTSSFTSSAMRSASSIPSTFPSAGTRRT